MGEGAAVAVVPLAVPISSDQLREALAEFKFGLREAVDDVRGTVDELRDAFDEADARNRARADRGLTLTYVSILFAPATIVYGAVAGFADSEDAAYWSIVMVLVTAIILYKVGGRELLRRISERPDDDG
jgi:hypothetical protein